MEKAAGLSVNNRPPRTVRRKVSIRRILLMALAGVGLLAALAAVIPTTRWADGSGYITTELEVELRPSVEGAIDRRLVNRSESVTKDQLVIQLKNSVQAAAREQALNQLKTRRAELEQLLSSQALKDSQTKEQIYQAQRKLQMAKERLAQMESARSGGFSPREIEEARLNVELITSQLAELNLSNSDLQAKQIQVLKEQISSAEQAVVLHEAEMKLREIRSPLDGTIYFNRFEPGEVVKPEHVLGQVFDTRCWIVKLKMPERTMKYVQADQEVEVELAAYPSLRFGYLTAVITRILPVVSPQASGDGIYYVEARLKAPPGKIQLQPGMTARASINTGPTTWLSRLLFD